MSLTDVEITRLFVAIIGLMGLAHLMGSVFGRLGMPSALAPLTPPPQASTTQWAAVSTAFGEISVPLQK